MSEKFNEGDIVYHKATLKRGVIPGRSTSKADWIIVWNDSVRYSHAEAELYTEKEYEEKYGSGVSFI